MFTSDEVWAKIRALTMESEKDLAQVQTDSLTRLLNLWGSLGALGAQAQTSTQAGATNLDQLAVDMTPAQLTEFLTILGRFQGPVQAPAPPKPDTETVNRYLEEISRLVKELTAEKEKNAELERLLAEKEVEVQAKAQDQTQAQAQLMDLKRTRQKVAQLIAESCARTRAFQAKAQDQAPSQAQLQAQPREKTMADIQAEAQLRAKAQLQAQPKEKTIADLQAEAQLRVKAEDHKAKLEAAEKQLQEFKEKAIENAIAWNKEKKKMTEEKEAFKSTISTLKSTLYETTDALKKEKIQSNTRLYLLQCNNHGPELLMEPIRPTVTVRATRTEVPASGAELRRKLELLGEQMMENRRIAEETFEKLRIS